MARRNMVLCVLVLYFGSNTGLSASQSLYFVHFGLVFIWRSFVFCLLLLLVYEI